MAVTFAITRLFKGQVSNEALMLHYSQSGQSDLLSQLYDNCNQRLYHFLLTHSNKDMAQDICQKTWLKVIEKKHLYQNDGRFIAWLFTLGRNLLTDEIRRDKKVEPYTGQLPTSDKVNKISPVSSSRLAHFNQALMMLSFEQKEAFVLQQEGFGLQEIADITHTQVETIKTRLRYARKNLRSSLENLND